MNSQRLQVVFMDGLKRTVGLGFIEDIGYGFAQAVLLETVPFRGNHAEAHALGCPCHMNSGYRMGQVVDVVTM